MYVLVYTAYPSAGFLSSSEKCSCGIDKLCRVQKMKAILFYDLLSFFQGGRIPDLIRLMGVGTEDHRISDLSHNLPERRIRVMTVAADPQEIDLQRKACLFRILAESSHPMVIDGRIPGKMKKIRVGKIGKAARQHGLAALQTIALQNLRILGLVSAVDIVDLISEKCWASRKYSIGY